MNKRRNWKPQTITAESKTKKHSYNLSAKYDNTRRGAGDKIGENHSEFKVAFIKNWFEHLEGSSYCPRCSNSKKSTPLRISHNFSSVTSVTYPTFCTKLLTKKFMNLKAKNIIMNNELLCCHPKAWPWGKLAIVEDVIDMSWYLRAAIQLVSKSRIWHHHNHLSNYYLCFLSMYTSLSFFRRSLISFSFYLLYFVCAS